MEVVGEAEDGRSSVTLVRELIPDVVVMDVKMPEVNGIEASRQILSELPDVKVIALSMYDDRRFIVDMLKAGAQGYLLKDCAFEELVHAIRLVMANKSYLSPGVAEVVIKDYVAQDSQASDSVANLTAREQEVLKFMAGGKRTAEIADLLGISGKTVDTHRLQIMHKLNLKSVAALTKFAIREGLISLTD
jgi:two-component system response regulator NreC